MKGKHFFCCAAIAGFLFTWAGISWGDNVWEGISRELLNAKSVALDPDEAEVIYLGTDKGLFRSQDSGKSWRNLFLSKTKKLGINLLIFDAQDKDILYAATTAGLFRSTNKGLRWERIFKGKSQAEAECLALVVLPRAMYLGTRKGLFVSHDKGRSWHKEKGKLGKTQIFNIISTSSVSDLLYLASTDGLFKSSDLGDSWERVFTAYSRENGKEDDSEPEDQDEEDRYSEIRYLAIDPNNPEHLLLATQKGIYESKDSGVSWENFPEYGLLSRDVYFIIFTAESRIFCISKSGVFVYRNLAWEELSLGLSFKKISYISLDKDGYLYACSENGLYRLMPQGGPGSKGVLSKYFITVPAIDEVQKAAIKYAEVDPGKIGDWRRQAAKKAWLPRVTAGFDQDINRTVSKSIWGTSGTNTYDGKHYIGPDDETNYNNKNWGVSLTWELGDLIWNSAQTSIDVRSRLMVQLRDDILDEVNKLYFERIRVMAELDGLPIEDKKKRFEKELRIRELTASLDGLTGGYFSRQIENNKLCKS
ncbi:MAG: hypothetical protein PHS12_05000 [Candidatus Omnitrophica bacterium]|nr:hypothetical protein [Candidatus Omnitrophota bacterium]MDD4982092.1 hypothetical protein [Candidatus Omnitrophota bacterium]MDD5665377.1 hypothetical protein [Candidatus Omnitrophota bacterium]